MYAASMPATDSGLQAFNRSTDNSFDLGIAAPRTRVTPLMHILSHTMHRYTWQGQD